VKKIVFAFGRMNPPTVGHKKLADKINAVARKERATARIYLSHTSLQIDPKNKKDPLSYDQKVKFAKQAFGNMVTKSDAKTVINVLKELQTEGFTDIIMVAGSDRVPEFDRLLNKYNGKDYTFNSIDVQSAGERDPDSEGVTGMSASKMRLAVQNNDMVSFKKGTPKGIDSEEMFNAVKKSMGLNEIIKEELQLTEADLEVDDDELDRELFGIDTNDDDEFDELDPQDSDIPALDFLIPDDELGDKDDEEEKDLQERKPLTLQQRLKMGRRMKRLAPRLARFRKIKAKRVAPPDRLAYRARKAALNILRRKVAGKMGANYKNLSTTQKISVDKMLEKKKSAVGALSKRLLPKVRKKEMERVAKARSSKNESFDAMFEAFDINAQFEQKVAQDPDVKDLPGTQPKKYYKGLSDKEKEARAKQFAKGADKPDNDPASYKPAPGDKGAKTKPSKYTQKYKQMYGEAVGARGDDDREADKNIIVQLRKAVDLKGDHPIVFDDGRKVKVKAGDAAKVLQAFNKIPKPIDKAKFQQHISKSHSNMKQVLSAGVYDIPPARASYISSEKINEMFGTEMMLEDAFDELIDQIELNEGKGKRQNIKSYSLFYLDPARSPLSHAVPTDNYQIEADDVGGLLTPKINQLLRMGMAKQGDLEKYRRALKSGEKGLTNPVLRKALLDILDKLINIVDDDTAAFQRVRNAVLKGRTDTGKIDEQDAVQRAKERISREKESDKQKFDAILDRARLRDTRNKNRKESYDDLEEKSIEGLKKKSEKSGVPYGILKKVYDRGMAAWKTGHRPGTTPQQWAFARVNSFLTGGKTRTTADKDLWAKASAAKKAKKESFASESLWANIHKKRERIKRGSGEKMRKVGDKGAPTPAQMKRAKGESIEESKKPTTAQIRMAKRMKKYGVGKNDDFYLSMMDPETRKKYEPSKRPAPMKVEPPKGKTFNWLRREQQESELEEMPRWLLEPLSKITNKKGYDSAKKVLQDVLTRKKKEAGRKGLQHTIEYYAQQIARQFDGVDARVLAKMVNEQEVMGPVEVGTDEIRKRYSDMTPGQRESYPRHAFRVEDLDEQIEGGEIRVGNYKTEFFHMCPFATKLYSKIDTLIDDMRTAERLAQLQDQLFYREKYIIQNNEASPEDVSMAQNLADQIMTMARMVGLEQEHSYIQGHVDKIKEIANQDLTESEYEGRKVKLNDPFRTPKGPKKFSVYVRNEKGNVVKVNFGDPNMEIKRDDPNRRKSFRSRHNCDNPGPKTKARYWSCRMWEKGKTVSELD
jgi:nicotinic acid mononucleotide adenylyltransferase